MEFTCRSCGRRHDLGEISFGAEAPVQWDFVSDAERAASDLGDEQCILQADGQRHFFVRACLDVPIRSTGRDFTWGVWVSLSEISFQEMSDQWEDPSRTSLGPYFGWLCTRIPGYPDTVLLKTMVHQREVGQRPTVELEPTDHPLSVDQRDGIEPARLQEIVRELLHPDD